MTETSPSQPLGSGSPRVAGFYADSPARRLTRQHSLSTPSDKEDTILSDFLLIQELLGEKGLSLNPEKTQPGRIDEVDVAQEIDEIKAGLLRLRREVVSDYAEEDCEEDEGEGEDKGDAEDVELDEEQVEYLFELLRNPDLDESDAELGLVLLRDYGPEAVLERMRSLLDRFPSLTRNVYRCCDYIVDVEELAALLLDFVTFGNHVTEEQLFWIAKIAEDHLQDTTRYADLLLRLHNHPSATEISRAKVLEIPDERFGLPEMRSERLRTGESNWSAWAAAVGSRAEARLNRNHGLRYFGNASPMNQLIATCVRALPD